MIHELFFTTDDLNVMLCKEAAARLVAIFPDKCKVKAAFSVQGGVLTATALVGDENDATLEAEFEKRRRK